MINDLSKPDKELMEKVKTELERFEKNTKIKLYRLVEKYRSLLWRKEQLLTTKCECVGNYSKYVRCVGLKSVNSDLFTLDKDNHYE